MFSQATTIRWGMQLKKLQAALTEPLALAALVLRVCIVRKHQEDDPGHFCAPHEARGGLFQVFPRSLQQLCSGRLRLTGKRRRLHTTWGRPTATPTSHRHSIGTTTSWQARAAKEGAHALPTTITVNQNIIRRHWRSDVCRVCPLSHHSCATSFSIELNSFATEARLCCSSARTSCGATGGSMATALLLCCWDLRTDMAQVREHALGWRACAHSLRRSPVFI